MEDSMLTSRRKRFQLSSLTSEEKERLSSYIKQLGGTYLDKQIFTKQVSHVICGKPNRSEKYLAGCVSGCWVLKKEYIEESFQHGRWLCEEDYEWGSEVLELDHPLIPLYDAPKKWRIVLKNKEGAFKNWNVIVHVQDNKMKKAYERLLEAGCATILKKRAPFQDTSLTKGVTHVFVEKQLKREVLCFEKDGIPCVSPDYIPEYIIQVDKDQAIANLTMEDRNNVKNMIKLVSKTQHIKGRTRGSLPGKENGPGYGEKGNEPKMGIVNGMVGKKGTKRQAPDCDMCRAKKQKTMNVVFPHYQSFRQRKNVRKAKNKHLVFPVYASGIVESCIDEGYVFLAMGSIFSSLSKNQAPSSECLHMIMNQFLLNSPSKQQAMQSYHLLNEILLLHPPASCQSLYLSALREPKKDLDTNEDVTPPWQFVSKVIRFSLDTTSNKETNRIHRNADMLLQFFDSLFKQDANKILPHKTPLILQILWPNGIVTGPSKLTNKEFVTLCYKCVRLAVNDKTKEIISQVLLDMLSLALTFKKLDDRTEKECCETIAQELFLVMSKNSCSETTKLLLQGCQSSWLKMRITELILGNFDKCLIPHEFRPFIDKRLSLTKIVSCYFYLLPKLTCKTTQKVKSSQTHTNQMSMENSVLSSSEGVHIQDDTVLNKQQLHQNIKRNAKGETPLHLACIHNDVVKVEEILRKGVDVNITDHAGWTALHEACNHGHVQCVEKILNYHKQTNKVDLLACPLDGTTSLHDAVLNHHLPVVKLLVEAGGWQLLQAKTSTGKTALDLAQNKEIANFLKLEMNKLKQNNQLLNRAIPQLLLPEEYDKIMNTQRNKTFVTTESCEEYLFLVSQLLQAYVKENILPHTKFENSDKECKNCKADFECWRNLSDYVESIEMHSKLITGARRLSPMCQLYLTSMKYCVTHL